jgi:HAD superfamily hydrolase (TIGR01509 family)
MLQTPPPRQRLRRPRFAARLPAGEFREMDLRSTAFELVIFDCDGVLIDSEGISLATLVAELNRAGVPADFEYAFQNLLGGGFASAVDRIAEDFGTRLPPAFEETFLERLLASFAENLTLMPRAAEVLDALALPYCVATSSSPRRAQASLGMVGLGHLRVFTAAEVARAKPAPDLFLHAAARSGARPEACLVIEDSVSGLRAARAAGMEVWRFTGGAHLAGRPAEEPEDARPDRRFASFADFFHIDPRVRRRG